MSETYDLVALGGGAGGLAAVRTAAAEGKTAALVTEGPIGGDCTWTGCVPSKTLLEAAASGMSFASAMQRVHQAIAHIAGTEDTAVLNAEGVDVIAGRGRLSRDGSLDVDGRRIEAGAIVVATGAHAALPPVPGLGDVGALTNENFWELQRRPASLAVLGGGSVGCELAQAMARFGTKVTLFEMAPRLLVREDPEASEVVRAALVGDGVAVHTSARIDKVERASDGQVRVHVGGHVTTVERLLVAAGRLPNTADLGLEDAGVALTSTGHIKVDRRLRTTADRIWAVGDVNGLLAFTHAADEQGRLAAWGALGQRLAWKFDATRVPWVTFTSPEVARVGLLEAEAPRGSRVAYLPMAENDRAVAAQLTEGFIKLIAAPRRGLGLAGGGKLVGATIVGARAGEMIHEPALAIRTNMFTGRLAQLSHAYPTWSVGIQKCAGQFFREVEGRSARPANR